MEGFTTAIRIDVAAAPAAPRAELAGRASERGEERMEEERAHLAARRRRRRRTCRRPDDALLARASSFVTLTPNKYTLVSFSDARKCLIPLPK
jgi:hypothetical protein